MDFSKVLYHYGVDKSHIPLSNSLLSNGSSNSFMIISSLKENKTMEKVLN